MITERKQTQIDPRFPLGANAAQPTDDELKKIAERFGTPAYVFDQRVLDARIEHLSARLPREASLCFAIKANPFVLPFLAGKPAPAAGSPEKRPLRADGEARLKQPHGTAHIERLEVCSPGELEICRSCGTDPKRIVVSGVQKNPALMDRLVADARHGDGPLRFTAESPAQLDLFDALSRKHGQRIPLLLRLTSGNQFGMDGDTIRRIVANRGSYPLLDICGIQFFSGTQKRNARRIVREIERLDAFLMGLERDFSWNAPELEMGPGLAVAYFAGDDFDEDDLLAELSRALDSMRFGGHISLEIGRSLVASCGTYLTSVVETKRNSGESYALVDGGIHHLAYFGQSMAMHRPPCHLIPREDASAESDGNATSGSGAVLTSIENASGDDAKDGKRRAWSICGSLCTANDVLAKQMPWDVLSPRDLIAFERAGAYCMTEGLSLFLSRDLPAVVSIDRTGSTRLIRRSTPTAPLNTPHQL